MNEKLYHFMKLYKEKNSDSNVQNFSDIIGTIKFLCENENDIAELISSSLDFDMGYRPNLKWLNNFHEDVKETGYIMSFKDAGDILVEDSQFIKADYMVYSVMFNYMQYIELVLKKYFV